MLLLFVLKKGSTVSQVRQRLKNSEFTLRILMDLRDHESQIHKLKRR